MDTPSRIRTISFVLLAGLLAAACGDDPANPMQPSPPAGGAGQAPVNNVVRILIKVPDAVAPEQTFQLHATALHADGTPEDVTSRTRWSSADPTLVRVEPDGVATALKVGETAVNANYQSPNQTNYGTAAVVVLVSGTYKLSGRMTDNGVAIANANVQVTDRSGADLRVLTATDGAFAVYGVAGRVQLRAVREGYATLTEEFDVTQTTRRDFEMIADRSRLDLSGSYTLTLTLGACDSRATGTFAAEFTNRQYNALVTQAGPNLALSLSGAEFITRDGKGDHFIGAVDPVGHVTFEIGDPNDWYLTQYPDLIERLNATSAFVAHGTVNAQATATSVVGTLVGPLMIASPANPTFGGHVDAWCYSEGHRFEMRRR